MCCAVQQRLLRAVLRHEAWCDAMSFIAQCTLRKRVRCHADAVSAIVDVITFALATCHRARTSRSCKTWLFRRVADRMCSRNRCWRCAAFCLYKKAY